MKEVIGFCFVLLVFRGGLIYVIFEIYLYEKIIVIYFKFKFYWLFCICLVILVRGFFLVSSRKKIKG